MPLTPEEEDALKRLQDPSFTPDVAVPPPRDPKAEPKVKVTEVGADGEPGADGSAAPSSDMEQLIKLVEDLPRKMIDEFINRVVS